ncbi:MFS transporter [Cochlodiniinecator piscidefendens]|uniref:MFS transporter n=1 Tax=Cochlodiniinecator piscidefendens TaxID=2715756 RepID=UPI00140CF00E|nr:MFS transporter [Cochlodiniinecator piscidefendens]
MSASTDPNTKTAEPGGWRDILSGEYAVVSAVLSGGIALHAINLTITATMLPSIVTEIGGQELYAWTSTLATLAAILSAAVTGKLLRRTGARVGFGISGVIFAMGCLIAALAVNMPMMLLARVVQGAGGGILFTLCYSMIVLVYPEQLWSRAMALLSGTWGIMMLFGPAVGGIFAEINAWRMGFGIMLPAVAIFVLLTLRVLPKATRDDAPPASISYGQLALLAGSILVISLGSIAPSAGISLISFAISVSLVVLLLRREASLDTRLFPRGTATPGHPLFLSFAVMALLIFCINAEFFMPYFLQRLHDMSPLMAGYVAAMVSFGWAGSEVYAARFTGRAKHRAIMAGPIIMLLSCMILAIATPITSGSVAVLIALMVGLVGLGVGIGIGWPHLNTFALTFAAEDERDMAASALSTVQMFSVAFGTALAGLVGNLSGFNDVENLSSISNSATWIFTTFGIVAVLAVITSRALINKERS